MRAALRALALGGLAAGLVAFVAAAATGVAAASAGLDLRASLGPLLLVAVERDGGATATTLGPGLAVVALAGGAVNAAAALVLRRGNRGREPFA